MADTAATTPAPTTPAKTRKIRDILVLHDLLTALGDGHVELLTDADGKPVLGPDGRPQRGKVTPYDLGLRARYALLKSLAATEKVVKRVQKTRDDAINAASGGKGTLDPKDENDAVKIKDVQAALDQLLDSDETVNLHQLPIEDLRLETNKHLSTSLILALGDMVSEPAA